MYLIFLQASSEYTRQSVELNASLMGMLQRTLDALAVYGLPVCSSDHSLKSHFVSHNLLHCTKI